jgi:predicted DNA-binding transcriptional regulator YafY
LSDGEIAEHWTERIHDAMGLQFDPNRGKEIWAGIGPDKPTTVVIDVDSERARSAAGYKWHDKQKTQTQRNGSVRITFKCDDYAPLLPWILRLGSHAKVIKPPALIDVVVDQIRATASLYSRPRKRR